MLVARKSILLKDTRYFKNKYLRPCFKILIYRYFIKEYVINAPSNLSFSWHMLKSFNIEEGESCSAVSREHTIHKQTLSGWMKEKSKTYDAVEKRCTNK